MTKLITEAQARVMLLRAVENGGGVTKWASDHGVSQGYVSNVLTGGRPITNTIASKIGLEACEQMYRRKATP